MCIAAQNRKKKSIKPTLQARGSAALC